MDGLRASTAAERKERAKAALKVSEGIVKEREAIVSELSLVRAINAKMVDERDLMAAENGTRHADPGGGMGGGGGRGGTNLESELLGRFASLQEAPAAARLAPAATADDDQEQVRLLASLNPLNMMDAELPAQNLERMQRLAVNGVSRSIRDDSDVECDDEFYGNRWFRTRPIPAARRSATATATAAAGTARHYQQSHPLPPLRRFHSHASSEVSLLGSILHQSKKGDRFACGVPNEYE